MYTNTHFQSLQNIIENRYICNLSPLISISTYRMENIIQAFIKAPRRNVRKDAVLTMYIRH